SFGGNAKFIWDNTNNRLGVGTSSPKNLFHLNGTSGVYEQFTNTATSASDANKGFKVGIDKFGNAQLIQYKDMSMMFYTNSGISTFERMRITSGGNVGVGTSFTDVLPPIRRLEVFYNGGTPQFRISYKLNATASLRVYTDFQTMSTGDLFINPMNGTSPRYVGIGVTNPSQKLDVDGNIRSTNLGGNGIVLVNADNNGTLQKILPGSVGQILTQTSSGIQWQNAAGGPSIWTKLGNQIYVTDINDKVAIGTTSSLAKFAVFNNSQEIAVSVVTDGSAMSYAKGFSASVMGGTGENIGLEGYVNSNSPNALNYGLVGNAYGTSAQNTGLTGSAYGASNSNIGINANAYGSPNSNYGIRADASLGSTSCGISASANNATFENYSINAHASFGSNSYGIYTSASNATSKNYGINANASFGSISYGIKVSANNAISYNYGIYASAIGNNSYSGYFDGNVHVIGNITATGSITPNSSDIMFKENINPIPSSINIITQLNPVKFNYKTNDFAYMNLPEGQQYGLISQEVIQVLPEIVKEYCYPAEYDSLGNLIHDTLHYKGLNYNAFIPIVIQAVKDQQTLINGQQLTIDSLTVLVNILQQQNSDSVQSQINTINTQLAAIQSCIDNLPSGLGCDGGAKNGNVNNNATTITHVELKPEEIILDQNNPNPFKETTTINYFIPDYIVFAQIIFTDNTGKIIKTVDINESGYGQLKVKAEKLMSGIYNYSIVIDGKIEETKKMVKN
ncbi:MAG: tail fiber domain-containing protein, partial [Bacteroidia bacterium]|nr:tail fiber domain-containing protein [Bacteroidia bacterium]